MSHPQEHIGQGPSFADSPETLGPQGEVHTTVGDALDVAEREGFQQDGFQQEAFQHINLPPLPERKKANTALLPTMLPATKLKEDQESSEDYEQTRFIAESSGETHHAGQGQELPKRRRKRLATSPDKPIQTRLDFRSEDELGAYCPIPNPAHYRPKPPATGAPDSLSSSSESPGSHQALTQQDNLTQEEAPAQELDEHGVPVLPDPIKRTQRMEALARKREKALRETRRQQKRQRVFLNQMRWLVRMSIAVAIVFGLWVLSEWDALYWVQPQYSMHNAQLLTPKDLNPLLDRYQGDALLQIDPEGIEKAIVEKFNIVDRVVVRRQLFPNQLNLYLMEKTAWAEVYESPEAPRPYALLTQGYDKKYYLIELQNYHFAVNQLGALPKVIVPQHVGLKTHFLGKLDPVVYQLNHIPGLHFLYLDSTQPDFLVAHFQEAKVILGRLDAHWQERLARIVPLAPKLPLLQKQFDSVDLRWTKQVTLHQKSKPAKAEDADPTRTSQNTPQSASGSASENTEQTQQSTSTSAAPAGNPASGHPTTSH
jgi:cell division septal protein FtsQ